MSEREAQKTYWQEHSSEPTVEAMMLDSKAAEIDQLERPEVLSTLGSVEGKQVLELGAGIGRFTGELAKIARTVTACDFMEVSIAENRRQHEALGNVSFLVADVTELQQPAGSYDVVFSNWLLMYLSDAEVQALASKILGWLSPGGTLFFRESCFRPSGDKPRSGNPTHYRNPRDYFAMFDKAEVVSADGTTSEHFELVCCKCVDTYVTVKKNQNQICWKFRKVVTPRPRPPLYRTFLDTHQYSDTSIAQYERVYGQGFISPGGWQVSAALLSELQLSPELKVLDIGCGIGGPSFLAADTYGCHVHGMDLSVNAILVAIERAAAAADSRVKRGSSSSSAGGGASAAAEACNGGHVVVPASNGLNQQQQQLPNGCSLAADKQQQQQMPHDVTFEVADMLTRDFPAGSFDVCISRDSLLHVADKQALFARVYHWVKPGGCLLITDYCKSATQPPSEGFKAYVQGHRYHLLTFDEYQSTLQAAGFSEVQVQDASPQFVASLENELAGLQASEQDFCAAFGEAAYGDMKQRWQGKLRRATAGEQLWAKIVAKKPLQQQ